MKINLTEEEVKTIRNCVLYVYDHTANCVDRAKLWDISRHLFQEDQTKENENDK